MLEGESALAHPHPHTQKHPHPPMHTQAHPHPPMHMQAHPHPPMHMQAHPHPPMHTQAHPHPPIHTQAHPQYCAAGSTSVICKTTIPLRRSAFMDVLVKSNPPPT
ncbi:hypothetical protein O181_090783 [Austropuccinia psidii MF-1]|uniref:Uncharacterized protein n=1 Tax=Austropuccinia psidii MF-1 TaxID=1389203 RepID=A0A9Q3IW36_9BASI|nr:hypothetical protein [Austropuccinia psidii MF-1]